jgi:hypothetical protein
MARSVSYPRGSIVAFPLFDEEEDDPGWAYDCLVEDVVCTARSALPSLQRQEGWRGREDRILLRNAFADCGISTYCCLAAIWLVERDDGAYWDCGSEHRRSDFAQRWITQVSDRFVGLFGDLRLVGRFSNGEAIFERLGLASQSGMP